MSKNGMFLSVIAVILAACYLYWFTDLFRTPTIQIIPTVRPGRPSSIPRNADQDPVHPVSFTLDGKYKLTSVKVVAAEDFKTNKYAIPLWHLISDSNSLPTKAIVYGFPIKGLKPAIPKAKPEPLLAGVEYTLLIECGKLRSRTNFHTTRAIVAERQ